MRKIDNFEGFAQQVRYFVDVAKNYDADYVCLLYTSDAADERSSVDLGGRRIIQKKTKKKKKRRTAWKERYALQPNAKWWTLWNDRAQRVTIVYKSWSASMAIKQHTSR